MNPVRVEHRLAAILSADVVGYTRLMAQDETATVQTLGAYREEIARLVRQHRGRVVDAPGDNLLAEFPSALDSVRSAIEIQQTLRARNTELSQERKMEYRVGIHLGDVRVEPDRIYGDGVNTAARLEGLAEPGGICISGAVHEQVRNKLDAGYDDLGEQPLKNLPQPVRVYRVLNAEAQRPVHPAGRRRRRVRTLLGLCAAVGLLIAAGVALSWPLALGLLLDVVGLSGPPVHPPLPDRPSIAVLPFTNLGGDPEQEYFSDGLTEDLTTDLSKSAGLFVISRNSAFTYKGRPVKVDQVGRELGVRYVLEGSVRREQGRVRITAQLIDATSGFHVWSERYDRELADLFTLQSEISEEILATLQVEINEAELERIRHKPTASLSALDFFQRGYFHFNRFTRKDNAEARRLFERALELDPDYGNAYAIIAATYAVESGFGWNLDPALMDRAEELAQRSLALDPSGAGPHVTLAAVNLFRGRHAKTVEGARRAIEQAPNLPAPHFFLGLALAEQGQIVGALQSIKRGLRLNPRTPTGYWVIVPWVNLAAGRKAEAVELFERIRAANPELIMARIPLAAIYELDGRHDEARTLVEEILRVNPDFTAELAFQQIPTSVIGGGQAAQFGQALRDAGLP